MKPYSESHVRSARINGVLLAGIGIYTLFYLWFTEDKMVSWIFPTGIMATYMSFSGLRLILKVRSSNDSNSVANAKTMSSEQRVSNKPFE